MNPTFNAIRHVYWALRYGEWSAGWGGYPNKPMFAISREYYDGRHCCLHVGPGWVAVYF